MSTNKEEIIKEYRAHENDTGSSEVQIAILDKRIKELTEHLKIHKKDFSSRRGLLKLVSNRKRLLKYLKENTPLRYEQIVKKLNLRGVK